MGLHLLELILDGGELRVSVVELLLEGLALPGLPALELGKLLVGIGDLSLDILAGARRALDFRVRRRDDVLLVGDHGVVVARYVHTILVCLPERVERLLVFVECLALLLEVTPLRHAVPERGKAPEVLLGVEEVPFARILPGHRGNVGSGIKRTRIRTRHLVSSWFHHDLPCVNSKIVMLPIVLGRDSRASRVREKMSICPKCVRLYNLVSFYEFVRHSRETA